MVNDVIYHTSVRATDGVGNSSRVRNFINSRRGTLSRQIPTRVNFSITTNGGTVDTSSTNISGIGWVDIDMLLVSGEPVTINWTSTTRWRVSVELDAGENVLDFLALDVEGNVVGDDRVIMTSTFGWEAPAVTSVVPASAQPGETVTVTGTEFHEGARVFLGTRELDNVEFNEDNPESLTFTVPLLQPGTFELTVRNTDGRTSEATDFTILPPAPYFIRGDANIDEVVDISDAVKTVRYLFSGAEISCLDAADSNDDEEINITDAVYLLGYLYRGGSPLAAPFPRRGSDPGEAGALDCETGLDPFAGG